MKNKMSLASQLLSRGIDMVSVIFRKSISYSNTNGAICANSVCNSGEDSQVCERQPGPGEEALHLKRISNKTQGPQKWGMNELECHWLRTSVRRKREIHNKIATCHTKQEQEVWCETWWSWLRPARLFCRVGRSCLTVGPAIIQLSYWGEGDDNKCLIWLKEGRDPSNQPSPVFWAGLLL